MVKSLPLNSALLEIEIPALAFNFLYAISVTNKILNPPTVCGIRLHLRIQLTNFRDSTYICGTHLQMWNPEQQAIFACRGIRGTTNVPTKFTLQVFVSGIHGSFVSGIH